jgi:hypothetical protein
MLYKKWKSSVKRNRPSRKDWAYSGLNDSALALLGLNKWVAFSYLLMS